MKRLLLLLLMTTPLYALDAPVLVPGAKTPLRNAYAQSDLDMRGFKIVNPAGGVPIDDFNVVHRSGNESVDGVKTFLQAPIFSAATASTLAYLDGSKNVVSLGTPTVRGLNKEIWIAVRTDTKLGSGTPEDPFNAGGANTAAKQVAFDALMTTWAETAGTIIHLLPGTYYSVNNGGNWCQTNIAAGVKIRGAGMWQTTIQNYLGTSSGLHMIYALTDNVEVSDLTLDANATVGNASTTTVGALRFGGNNELGKNVRVINDKGPTGECFPIFVSGGASSSLNNDIIDGCVVTNFIGTNSTMIIVSVPDANSKLTNCTIRNCYVAGGGMGYTLVGGLLGYGNSCENNNSDGSNSGYNHDSWQSTGERIVGNRFTNCGAYGIILRTLTANSVITDAVVEDNIVSIASATTVNANGVLVHVDGSGQINGLILRNNEVYYYGAGGGSNMNAFDVNITTNLIAENNRCSTALGNPHFWSNGAATKNFNNTNLDGTPMFVQSVDIGVRTIVPKDVIPGAGQLSIVSDGGSGAKLVNDSVPGNNQVYGTDAVGALGYHTGTSGVDAVYTVTANRTTIGQTLVDVTDLVTGTLSVGTLYEFEADLYCGTSAGTDGTQYGVNVTVAPLSIVAQYTGPTAIAGGVQTEVTEGTIANNTATGSGIPFLTASSETGFVCIKGIFKTDGIGSPVFSIRHLKTTSGTSTVFAGSILKLRSIKAYRGFALQPGL